MLSPFIEVADASTDAVLRRLGPFGDGVRPYTVDGRERFLYANVNHLQGFEIADLATGRVIHRIPVAGFPYDPGIVDPSHGIGLTPDERELWVAGATPYVHVYDNTVMPPAPVASIPVSGIPKWITFTLAGDYAYPGSGDVISTASRQVVAHVAASKRQVEVDFLDGSPVRAASMYGLGYVR